MFSHAIEVKLIQYVLQYQILLAKTHLLYDITQPIKFHQYLQ